MRKRLDAITVQWRMSDWYNVHRLYDEVREKYGKLQEELRKAKEKLRRKDEEIDRLRKENGELKGQLKEVAEQKKAKKPRFSLNYSVHGQEKKGQRQPSPGRTPKEEKMDRVDREEDVYPERVPRERCRLSHTRIVTHIRNGRKETVLYRVYREIWGEGMGQVPGALPGGEYGLEVAVTLAFLVFVTEVSIKSATDILFFFTGVELSDSRANALLDQLSRMWDPELENLTTLLTLALLVHIDETGWKTGKERNYAWIFASLSHAVFLYGESRGEETIEKVLSRAFPGIAITDCLSTYEKYFKNQQKCWAHFLRVAIRLMLLHPRAKTYKQFFDTLFAIFRTAKATQKDNTLTEKEKKERVATCLERIDRLCKGCGRRMTKKTRDDVRECTNLKRRLRKYRGSLFTFVLHPEVDPTNNRAEQGLRKTAKARNNYQTSKTEKGAHRRSVLVSVLTSLQKNLPSFSLETVIGEVTQWRREGISLFGKQLSAALARASPG